MKGKKLLAMGTILVVLSMILVPGALAHGCWFANRLDQTQLVLGEGAEDNAYEPSMVTSIQGYDAQYGETEVARVDHENYVTIERAEGTSVVAAEFDYGFWSKDGAGNWQHKPMNELEGAVMGLRAMKYSVNYFDAVSEVKPLEGMAYQLVPSVDPTTLNVGDTFTVQALHDGQPIANAVIIPDFVNHFNVTVTADENGVATVTAANGGLNVIGLEMMMPCAPEETAETHDHVMVFSSLSFTLHPEE